jgi:hypothetical protein
MKLVAGSIGRELDRWRAIAGGFGGRLHHCLLALPACGRSCACHEQIFSEFWADGGQKSAARRAKRPKWALGPAEDLRR